MDAGGGAGGASSRQPVGGAARAEAQRRTAVDGAVAVAVLEDAHQLVEPPALLGVTTESAACGDGGGSPAAPTPVTTTPVDTQSEEETARQTVDTWLSLIDAGNYSEAYEATGSFFRESVTAEEFRDIMEERLALLGAFESRTLSSTRRLTVVPDAPPGGLLRVRVRRRLRVATGRR